MIFTVELGMYSSDLMVIWICEIKKSRTMRLKIPIIADKINDRDLIFAPRFIVSIPSLTKCGSLLKILRIFFIEGEIRSVKFFIFIVPTPFEGEELYTQMGLFCSDNFGRSI